MKHSWIYRWLHFPRWQRGKEIWWSWYFRERMQVLAEHMADAFFSTEGMWKAIGECIQGEPIDKNKPIGPSKN